MTKGRAARLLAAVLLTATTVATAAGQAWAQNDDTVAPGGAAADTRSAPTSASTLNGTRTDVFRTVNGQIQQNTWTTGNGWSQWTALNSPFGGAADKPGASWLPDGSRLDLFVGGKADQHLYQKTWTPATGWSFWVDLGKGFLSPSSAAWTNNGARLDLFSTDNGFGLLQKTWLPASGWSAWTWFDSPGPNVGSDPAISWTPDGKRLDVFVRAQGDNGLYQRAWTADQGWGFWTSLGGQIISAPGAHWVADGSRIDIFAVGINHQLYQKYWTRQAGWVDWFPFTGPAAGQCCTPAVNWAPDGTRLDVFSRGADDGVIYQKTWTSSTNWSTWSQLP
jgi:hypothetical protein